MRKSIFTIGMFVTCLSIFFFSAVSSDANPDQLVTNALDDLKYMSIAVIKQRQKVNAAWPLVDILSSKWSEVSDANRYNTTTNYVVDLLGSGFWAIAAGLAGNTDEAFRSYYANVSLMDLYSSKLNDVSSNIDQFYATVMLYNSAHTTAVNTVEHHETSQHTSPSNVNHLVPMWSEETCRDNLPSFLCRGNSCDDSFPTPSDAYNTHQEICVSDGIKYYTCDEVGNAKHKKRTCVKDYTNPNGVTSPCGVSYRNCANSGRDHNESNWWFPFKSKHSDSSDDDSASNPPTDNTPDCSYCTDGCSSCPNTGGALSVRWFLFRLGRRESYGRFYRS